MAKRRDQVTRMYSQAARDAGKTVGQYAPVANKAWRVRGRRAVRARARQARIAARQANGTYTQPSGGTGTNS